MSNSSVEPEGPEFIIERTQGIAVVTYNRAASANAINRNLGKSLIAALDELEDDETVAAVVITGAGKIFCSGGKMGDVMNVGGVEMEQQIRTIRDTSRAFQRIRDLELPVVCALNGPAIGGGTTFAMSCDFVVAAENAFYSFPFGTLGASAADMGGAYILRHIVGSARAKEILMLGEKLDAGQLKRDGLAFSVVPKENVLDAAKELAQRLIAANSRRAFAGTKQILLNSESADIGSALFSDLYVQSYMLNRPEHDQLLSAAIESRRKK